MFYILEEAKEIVLEFSLVILFYQSSNFLFDITNIKICITIRERKISATLSAESGIIKKQLEQKTLQYWH